MTQNSTNEKADDDPAIEAEILRISQTNAELRQVTQRFVPTTRRLISDELPWTIVQSDRPTLLDIKPRQHVIDEVAAALNSIHDDVVLTLEEADALNRLPAQQFPPVRGYKKSGTL